jgi:hypothetical protein
MKMQLRGSLGKESRFCPSANLSPFDIRVYELADAACRTDENALNLTAHDRRIDSGLFHVFSDEDRVRYVAGLTHVTNPGGRLFLLCFSDEEPGEQGPRRVSQRELRESFANGWAIEEIRPVHLGVRPDLEDFSFSEGGPKGWFAVIRRLV